MLNNWLNPVSQLVMKKTSQLSKYQFGKAIAIHHTQIPSLKTAKIALIGMDNSCDMVRLFLYEMAFNFEKLSIVDLGNLINEREEIILFVLKELLKQDIVPILIGKKIDNTYIQYLAYQAPNQLVNMTILDERIRFELLDNKHGKSIFYLNHILNGEEEFIFNLGLMGYQSHFVPQNILNYLEKKNFDCLRVGNIRNNIKETEPLIRDADLISINLAVLKKSEAPGQKDTSPNGLFTEEICQIAYYAGMSDKLSSIGFYGFEPTLDRDNQTAQVVAQMVWYFIHGFYHRKHDYPISLEDLVEYVVNFKDSDFQIIFWKSTKSNRWWVQIPTSNKKQKRHQLVPCSYQDYQMAGREELSERLLTAFSRFS